jgi:serine/threonine protein kinase
MVFPWAESNLEEYWAAHPAPYSATGHDITRLRWVSDQLLGLARALQKIHQPIATSETDQMVNGRHGDIKPRNMLWFKAENEGLGNIVLADFGLAKIHVSRTQSRSIRSQPLGFTLAYSPPEIMMEASKVSRSADIWSLGCVFLEMVCWILGGPEEVERFSSERNSESSFKDYGGFFSRKSTLHGRDEFSIKDSIIKVSTCHCLRSKVGEG